MKPMDIGRRMGSAALCALFVAVVLASTTVPVASASDGKTMDIALTQPPNYLGSKISAEDIPSMNLSSEVANDFSYSENTTITRVSWWGGPYRTGEGQQPTTFNVIFYEDNACTPGNLASGFFSVPVDTTFTGTDGRGFPVYRYDAYVRFDVTANTRYWMSVQSSAHDAPPQWGRLESTDFRDCDSMIRSTYFGYPNWTTCSSVAGHPWDASQQLEFNTVTIEACCLTGGVCTTELPDSCTAHGGTPQGAGTSCTPNPCPEEQQACCSPAGECTMRTVINCAISGGFPQGPGTTCDPNPCGAQEACCLLDGSCEMLPAQTCLTFGGAPQGTGTVCDPNPCTPAEACCFPDGSCIQVVPDQCVTFGGSPFGAGSTCEPSNPCPQPPAEACCYPDGHCEMLAPLACDTAGGNPQGSGTTCDPNPCPQPQSQACCFPDGACTFVLATDCLTAGGNPAGPATTCTPNDCPLVIRVQSTTWGGIKSLYR